MTVPVLQYPQYYSHRFVALHRSNYTVGRAGIKPQYVVIHIMEGTYAGSISWGQNPASNVSWHYAVARDGHTTQCVSENNACWTNSVWAYNLRGVNIEHGGYCRDGGPSEAQLHASAKLTAGICLRHDIPINRNRIFGHTEIPGANKPCPCTWPWQRYINLVKQYARVQAAPAPSQPPAGTVFRVLAGSFGERSNAQTRANQIKAKGFGEPWIYRHGNVHRVQVASFSDPVAADQLVMKLKAAKFEAYSLAEKS